MKKNLFILVIVLWLLSGCAPVLNRDVMKQGLRDVPMTGLRQYPDEYKGRLFVLGGVIVETRLMEKGSQVEALFVPVDSYGYLRDQEHRGGRFLAVYPSAKGILDPLIYKKGREITLAGEFVEARKGKIDEMEYVYPVFEIREIYLWEERNEYYAAPYYPYYYSTPFLYDPWGRPYPNPYWPPMPRY